MEYQAAWRNSRIVGSLDKGIINWEKEVWHRRNSSKGRAGRGMKIWENTRKIHSRGALGSDFPGGEGAETAPKGNSRISQGGKRRWETLSGKQQIRKDSSLGWNSGISSLKMCLEQHFGRKGRTGTGRAGIPDHIPSARKRGKQKQGGKRKEGNMSGKSGINL